jgi:hypothetical protein
MDRGRSLRYLASWSYLYGTLVNAFMIFVFHLTFVANVSNHETLDNTNLFLALGVLLIATTVGVIALLLRFGASE